MSGRFYLRRVLVIIAFRYQPNHSWGGSGIPLPKQPFPPCPIRVRQTSIYLHGSTIVCEVEIFKLICEFMILFFVRIPSVMVQNVGCDNYSIPGITALLSRASTTIRYFSIFKEWGNSPPDPVKTISKEPRWEGSLGFVRT